MGKLKSQNCFICRKYLSLDCMTQYKALFRCKECMLPFCLNNCCNPENGRVQTCADEHFSSANAVIKCSGVDSQFSVFPCATSFSTCNEEFM